MFVVDNEKYKMEINEEKKQVIVQIIGFIKEYLVEEYLKDLHETVNKVPRSNYTLIIDATYQSPLPSKVRASLGDTIMYYVSFGFKENYIVNPKSKISKVQVRSAIEEVNFPEIVVNHIFPKCIRGIKLAK